MKSFFSALFIVIMSVNAFALAPGERLSDPSLEARARVLSSELRCLVCQNQSIDDSDADLAKDLRRIVRERLAAGDTDSGVKDYLVQRYGEFVLLNPVFSIRNAGLWLLPFFVLILGGLAASRLFRRKNRVENSSGAALTLDEQVELQQLTGREQ